jgi:orotate phosphoribosyltransferase
MNFVSFQRMLQDVRDWSARLPSDLAAVAGVPRSGLVVASLLALHRNVHLVTLDELRAGARPWTRPLRRGVAARTEGPVLVVDDSINSGATLEVARNDLGRGGRFLFGALYYSDRRAAAHLDFVHRHVPSPRCFEWNVFHCRHVSSACLDLDGVLCEDWTGREEDGEPGRRRYLEHLERARPRFLPTGYPALAIVTSRLETYRRHTEAWLARHGVRYGELVMSPHPSAEARRNAADAALRKAAYYCSRSDARVFIESDPGQARAIAAAAGKPVLCTDTMEMIAG